METSTQVRHPWRATIRTVLAGLLGAASLLPTIAVTAGVETVPAVAQAVAVAGVITRVMAVPGVDAWLRRYLPWLASTTTVDK